MTNKMPVTLRGYNLLNNPKFNKGSAFSKEERYAFRISSRLPCKVETLEEQIDRAYKQFSQKKTNLQKNIYLNALHDNNEVLFYALLDNFLGEMLPIVYTPTVATAVETFSLELRRYRGLFISYPDIKHIDSILEQRTNKEIDLILISDGEGVLGIGDWGIGGMHICIGKLMVYTACGGLNPNRVLPIQLDVGTNNEFLLKQPEYLGLRHKRITGDDYDNFIDQVVQALQRKFPNAFLHWEDFGRDNARKNLMRYINKMPTFNDDMQGTGATALACLLSGMVAKKERIRDQKIVFFGAGTAGCGIADQICRAMVHDGLTEQEARNNIYLIGRNGLICNDSHNAAPFQKTYQHDRAETSDWQVTDKDHLTLLDVVTQVKPSVLIGCSTVHNAFTEEVVKAMAEHCDRPIILPLSNPNSCCEANPIDLLTWTKGRILMALGSPFDPVEYQGKTYRISQCNNAFVFPGIGRGVIAAKAKRVSEGMIFAACQALSLASPARDDISAPLLPDLSTAKDVADSIAIAVAEQARSEGLATVDAQVNLAEELKAQKWSPCYQAYNATN